MVPNEMTMVLMIDKRQKTMNDDASSKVHPFHLISSCDTALCFRHKGIYFIEMHCSQSRAHAHTRTHTHTHDK